MGRSTTLLLRAVVPALVVVLCVPHGPASAAQAGPAEAVGVVHGKTAGPVPAVPLPSAVDLPAFYEPQTTCAPTARPGAVRLGRLLQATYGPATVYIGRSCTSSTSEHFDGRAVDWMRSVRVPAQRAQAEAFLSWLLAPGADGTPQAMARRLGVMYVIWNNRMIRMYDPGRGWTNYRGCQAASKAGVGLDTSCHRNHIHLSLSWDGAAGVTSFWTGTAQRLTSCSARTTRASRRAGTARVVNPAAVPGLRPITPTRVLDTAAGAGAGLTGPCRLRASRSLYPSVRVGAVPATATWAAVRITSTSNAPARLSAWSSGGASAAAQVATPMGTTTATVLVPIASDGTIGLTTSMGSARVVAAVVGYLGGPPPATQPAPRPAPKVARPSVPRSVKATSRKRAVTTKWKAPKTNGGAAITGYRVEALSSAKKGAAVAGACATPASGRRCTIKGLVKGHAYWMSVSVGNAAGRTWANRVRVVVR